MKKIAIFIILIFMSLQMLFAGDTTALEHYTYGEQFLENKSYKNAVIQYTRAIAKSEPN